MGIVVKAPAKINLSLDITGRREDGYHLVSMVMQSVDLFDQVEVERGTEGIALTCSRKDLPVDHRNLAYQAAQRYLDSAGLAEEGVLIHLQKNIPMAAGLAGGSADAAAVLLALNELYGGRIQPDDLMELASQLGADVPFCLKGGTALAQGIGTELSPLPALDCYPIVLCKPDVEVSTQEAYRRFDGLSEVKHPSVEGMVRAIQKRNLGSIASLVGNVFEQVVALPDVAAIRKTMQEEGALASCMSGSGPTVFGIFQEEAAAERCCTRLLRRYGEVYVTHPVDHGCQIS